MIVKRDKEDKKLLNLLLLLKLTPKNMVLAQGYLDMSKPEDKELLKHAEHQDFTKLGLGQKEFIYKSLSAYKGNHAELAERLVRFLAEVGGATSRRILSYYGWNSDFKYMENILPLAQVAVLYADWIAWNTNAQCASSIRPLISLGKKDPEIFQSMTELCYNDDACNTEMFLAAMYLHCVKPLEESRSILYAPIAEDAGEDRARDYLLGIAEIQDILPYVEQWREQSLSDSQKYERIHGYLECGEEQLYRRALVLEALRLRDTYFMRYWVDGSPAENGGRVCKKSSDASVCHGFDLGCV